MSFSTISSIVFVCIGIGATYQMMTSPSLNDRVGSLIGSMLRGAGESRISPDRSEFKMEDEEDRPEFEARLEAFLGREEPIDFTQSVAQANEELIQNARRHIDHGSVLLGAVIQRDDALQRLIKEVGVDEEVYVKLSRYAVAELLVAPLATLPRFMDKGRTLLTGLKDKFAALSFENRKLVIDHLNGDGAALAEPVKGVWRLARSVSHTLVHGNQDFSVCVEKATQPYIG